MDHEIDEGTGYDYGAPHTTGFYELMAGQFLAERAAGLPASEDPALLWLALEASARGDARIDRAAHRAALAANRWLPVLYEVDGAPGLGDPSPDDAFDPALLGAPGAPGCRARLIALLALLDGPGVTRNFDIDALVRAVRRRTGGYDAAAVGRSALLRLAEEHRRPGH